MKSRKLIAFMGGMVTLIAVLIGIILLCEPQRDGISRAEVARAVVLALKSPEEVSMWRQEAGSSHFSADTQSQWYIPWMDYLYENGFLTEEETPADEKTAEGWLTYGEAQQIAETSAPTLGVLVDVTKKNRNQPYPEDSWWILYDAILKSADPKRNVKTQSVLVYGTPETVPSAEAWTVYTNLGQLRFDGLTLDAYLDHELEAYVRGNQLIHVIADNGQNTTYRNVWVIDADESEMKVYLGDLERTISFRRKVKKKKVEEMVRNLADIQMEKGKIAKVSLKQDTITGKVLSVRSDSIEIEGYGSVPFDKEYKVLRTYGTVKRENLSDILIGYDQNEFVVAKGKICAVLTVRDVNADTIRVLLMNNGFKSIFHDTVTISCSGAMTMTQGDQETTLEAGSTVSFSKGDGQLTAGRIILKPQNETDELTVPTLERTLGTPSYAGRLEIVEADTGLVLMNELYLEDYLKKVVPSEMPPNYEKEALKAQAVCARTYAYMQIQSNTYSQYGAHVDDSTNFQVYNNVETNERTREAVEETYGKMLLYKGKPVSAYYFSTSCGTTTDGSIWGNDSSETPYLKSVALSPGRKTLDLTENADFSSFIKEEDYPAYDSSYPFYRWNVMTNAQILGDHIGGIGTIESVKITERGPGGVALKILVKGSEGEKTISGQNAIRSALGDSSLTIKRKDGKTSEGWSSLPSAFLTVEDVGKNDKGITRFKIYGGGYGHGAGMSQNGAQGMAKDGMTCEEILKFFYEGVSVAEPPIGEQQAKNAQN